MRNDEGMGQDLGCLRSETTAYLAEAIELKCAALEIDAICRSMERSELKTTPRSLADEEGRIDPKCFEKICNACIKAALVAAKVGDQAVAILKQVLQQVTRLIHCYSNRI